MRLSVLLPAKNAAATVELAVRSVLTQTVRDFELLAIDDGSTDDTRARLDALAAVDPRLRVLSSDDRGLVAALNLGLAHARAPLIARMDADDESHPERFAVSLAALEANPGWAGVGTGVEIFREDRPPSPNLVAYGRWLSSLTSPALLFRDRFIESPLCHPSVLLRREALGDGWRTGDFPEDWELWLRLLEAGQRLSCVPRVLLRWRDHEQRLTRSDPRCARPRLLALKADFLARLLGDAPLTLWGATDTGLALSTLLRARGARVTGFIELDPRKVGQTIHGVRVRPLEATPPDGHVLLCVAAKGAREKIRAWLTQRGKTELKDFTCVA